MTKPDLTCMVITHQAYLAINVLVKRKHTDGNRCCCRCHLRLGCGSGGVPYECQEGEDHSVWKGTQECRTTADLPPTPQLRSGKE
jgi:hypothetical protein